MSKEHPQPFPQYAKTENQQVIDVVTRNKDRFDEFLIKAAKLAEEMTGDKTSGRFNGSEQEGAHFFGFEEQYRDVLPGQWKKPDRGIISPYQSNPVRNKLREITVVAAPIPGGRRVPMWGSGFVGPGALFVYDGVAYSGFDFLPEGGYDEWQEYGWTEILPREFREVVELENARRRQAQAATEEES